MALVALFVQEGFSIDYTPSADVAAGDVVDMGTMVGIAPVPISANVQGAIQVRGVYDVSKYANEAISLWDVVYWDEGTKTATKTVGYSEAVMGRCVKAAAAGDERVRVMLIPSTA